MTSNKLPEKVNLGRKLKRLRKETKFSQEELAEALDFSPSTIAKIEQGVIENPGFFTVERIAEALNASLDSLATNPIKTPQSSSDSFTGHHAHHKKAYFGSEPNTLPVKFVYFGMSNVLVTGLDHVYVRLARDVGHPPQQVEETFWQSFPSVLTGDMSLDQFVVKLNTTLSAEIDTDRLLYHIRESAMSFNPAHKLLQTIAKEHPVGLLANTPPSVLPMLFAEGSLPKPDQFAQVLESWRAGCQKNDSSLLQLAAKRAGVELGSILLIDGSLPVVEAAIDAGWQAVYYSQDHPERSQKEVLELLENSQT